jgi:hypothetical protein
MAPLLLLLPVTTWCLMATPQLQHTASIRASGSTESRIQLATSQPRRIGSLDPWRRAEARPDSAARLRARRLRTEQPLEAERSSRAALSIKKKSYLLRRNIFVLYTAKTKCRKFETNIPRKGISGLIPNFHIHACVCERIIYSHDGSAFSAGGNMWTDPGNI